MSRPSVDSRPGVRTARSIAAVTLPTITLAIGAAKTLYSAMSAVMSAAFGTSWVTIRLFTWIEPGTKSPVARSRVASMSVMSRPCEAAPVTILAVDEAVDRPVRVAGDDDVDLVIHGLDDRHDVAARVVAGGDERSGRRPSPVRRRRADDAALVQEDDDGLDARAASGAARAR